MKLSQLFIVVPLLLTGSASAEVLKSSAGGFQIRIERELDCDEQAAYSKLVTDFNKWYDASHSYSQNAEKLSLDLDRHCMYEEMPEGGFVRHMEIVFHQPGKLLRMTGGLGPLQGMGISGAMTFEFSQVSSGNYAGQTKLTLMYVVTGAEFQELDKIAGPVDQVLVSQLDRFQEFCKQE